MCCWTCVRLLLLSLYTAAEADFRIPWQGVEQTLHDTHIDNLLHTLICIPDVCTISCMQHNDEDFISTSQVTVDGPQPTPVQAGAIRAGVCAFTYHAHGAGTYTVTASIRGIHVRNSPAVVVASIAEACPSQCEVKGTPLTLSMVRRFLMFMV